MERQEFYQPTDRGFEQRIRERMAEWERLRKGAGTGSLKGWAQVQPVYISTMARSTTYSALRSHLKYALICCADHEPLRVERKNGEAVVVRPEATSSLGGTAYCFARPRMPGAFGALHGGRRSDRVLPTSMSSARTLVLAAEALDDLRYWVETDPRKAPRF